MTDPINENASAGPGTLTKEETPVPNQTGVDNATSTVFGLVLGFLTPMISLFSNQGIPSKCQTTSNRIQFFGFAVDDPGRPSHPIVNISGSF